MTAAWSSADVWISLAGTLLRHGPADVAVWLAKQESRVGDPAFAGLFEEAARRLGLSLSAFSHRVMDVGEMRLLAGIRFFGQDLERPFVEILAWDGPPWPSPSQWSSLREAVAREWSAFRPAAVRLFHPVGLSLPEDAALDMSLHAAPYAAMSRGDTTPDARFASETDGTVATALVAARYLELGANDAGLARDLAPIEEDRLRTLAIEGRVMRIEWRGRAVGLLAWEETSAVEWVRGDVVAEEVVLGEASGQGLAAAAQRELARRRAEKAPETLLLGTILKANHASRRTALHAGRPEIARYSFLPLRRAKP